MATPDTETLNVPLTYIQEYLGAPPYTYGESSRLQKPLDDAIIRAEDNARAEFVPKSVIVKIVPDGAVNPGVQTTLPWTLNQTQEYLRPPGDSTIGQTQLNNALTVMARSAVTNNTVTEVIIKVDPNLSSVR